MAPKPLCPELSVDKQIDLGELPLLKAQGYRSIINNRPDNEEPGQPSSAEVEQAAKAAGLAYAHIPVVPGQFGDDQIAAYAKAMETLPHPILAYCKSGMRASSLWALCSCPVQGADSVMDKAREAGYDLSPLQSRLKARSG